MRAIALSQLKKKGIEVITDTMVTKVEPNLITFADGKSLKANTIIWVAGVKPSLSEIKGIEIGPKGRLEINEYLQSIKNLEIFGLGDSAGTHPMLAQIAVQQAKTVANNIYALVNNKELEKFTTKIKGLLISLGQWSAAGQFRKITLSGPIMWWIWRTIYLFNFNSWKKRFEIVIEWTINLFYPRDITHLK
jgi:NADH dehydrogenase